MDKKEKLTSLELSKKKNYLSIVIFGASGDLAKRKIFPALFYLFKTDRLPKHFHIYGYARSNLKNEDLLKKINGFLEKHVTNDTALKKKTEFFKNITYVRGLYDKNEDYKKLNDIITLNEKEHSKIKNEKKFNRLFYLSLPPTIFLETAVLIGNNVKTENGWNRIVIEKPFGRDSKSFEKLSNGLNSTFLQKEIYRMDHYIGKEVVQNLLVLRFANLIFEGFWNRNNVQSVQIIFKESLGVEGRGGYFDNYGIIRDVMQNHLLQILALIAMEQPLSLSSEDIKNEKVKVLKSIAKISMKDVVIGQYKGKNDHISYRQDETVDNESNTPTFAALVLKIKNRRWDGVPFLLKCGKGLDESKAEIRIQFNKVPANLYGSSKQIKNELVIRVQPNESIYFNIMNKEPGLKTKIKKTKLDFTYKSKTNQRIPDAYERLIKDCINGKTSNFVYEEELRESWKIFTPILKQIQDETPEPYYYGSRGPVESDYLAANYGCKWSEDNDDEN